ncbi:unnamed protein product [Lasius platythorax]|uniref:Uncharacterized protein n=1 Tax=Lasius platythorax TaxID=488582 RepID=A0AAV2PDT7_9HYME
MKVDFISRAHLMLNARRGYAQATSTSSDYFNETLGYSCVEQEQMQFVSEGLEIPLTRAEAMQKLRQRLVDDYSELLHNVSSCHLPAARKIMQRRFQ